MYYVFNIYSKTLLSTICDSREQFELTINKKTKTMVISKRGKVTTRIQMGDEGIEQVNKMKYIRVWITEDLNLEKQPF